MPCYTTYSGGNIIGLFGQSNAVGNEPIANLQGDLVGSNTNAKIFAYSNVSLNGTWSTLQSNVNNSGNTSSSATFGIEMRLMKLMGDTYGANQKLLKYAIVGSSLATNWLPGAGNLYGLKYQVQRYAQAAFAGAFGSAYNGFKCIVWIQWEADSPNLTNYQSNLKNLIKRWRQDFLQPTIPIIIVSASNAQTNYTAPMRAAAKVAQQAVSKYLWSNYVVTTNSGVDVLDNVWYLEQNETTSDSIHYTATSYNNIALYVFDIIQRL
ncbi:MAG TPA: sialate O-acetylesterase [Flavitalea sp.]|nr:sialate O-acetylesterase [Flavitalea sp.]